MNFTNIFYLDQVDSANMSTGLISNMVDSYYIGYKASSNRFWVILNYVNYDMEGTTLSF